MLCNKMFSSKSSTKHSNSKKFNTTTLKINVIIKKHNFQLLLSTYNSQNIILTLSQKNCMETGADQTSRHKQTENVLKTKAKYKVRAIQKEFLKPENQAFMFCLFLN